MAKRLFRAILVFLGILITLLVMLVLFVIFSENGKLLFPVKRKGVFYNERIETFPSFLSVKGSQILDANGKIVIFRGLMPPDPARLHSRNMFKRDFFVKISETGANVVRIPVHPESWVKDEYYIWRYLDPIVSWAGELGMYVIIDWHYIGNINTGVGENMSDVDTSPKELTIKFWRQTANYFKDVPNVIFEIFNEPSNITAKAWHESATEIVKLIREQKAYQLIIVGGIDYSKDISWVKRLPILDKNVAYASHIYPAHNRVLWDYYFGKISKIYPVVITEWGFMDENRNTTNQKYLIGDENSYGKVLMEYLVKNNIGWIACWYDDKWEPQMFTKKFKGYTDYGKFVLNQLKKSY
ncbi:glycoside hydrolase family 5 protein [Thermosipho ferrireducens]|uniref:Glycoside hydrolase family 5 protein n=1 Tax=Thermosipho ferrireducens TaxID=2571116 RepID=A0ABX7S9L0_9BACT|nr:glycoside hydrolase family 5 protein [Thermosipho ferrireducens]QTA37905.1 glycoside hydrolase family 5 protein [Thermosipho ferrireducens]